MYDLCRILTLSILLAFLNSFNAQDLATQQTSLTICSGSPSQTIKCTNTAATTYTVGIDEALYGLKNPSTITCAHNTGDCYQTTSINCSPTLSTCPVVFSISFALSACTPSKPDYLHVRYKCIPWTSSTIPTYNVCDQNDITSGNGFITSPNYPSYSIMTCTRKIVAPADKVIRIRVLDMQIKTAESDKRCLTDYLKITDSTGDFVTCGTEKAVYDNKLCSSVIYVTYRAGTTNPFLFKGFKLYYEFAERNTQPDCPTATPPVPFTTTPIQITTPIPQITDLIASPIQQKQICRGTEDTITPYKDYSTFFIKSYYGVPSSLICETISASHCTAPAKLDCSYQVPCRIPFYSDIPIGDCGGQKAVYLGIEYRFLPILSSKNFSICDGGDIDGSSNTYGIITSRNYPNFVANENCVKRIVAPANRRIRVYLTDISIDPKDGSSECSTSFVSASESNIVRKFCGSRSEDDVFYYTSCSNILSIQYKSSASATSFRGFNMYYEIIDGAGVVCPGVIVPITTTTSTTPGSTTVQPDVVDLTSQVLTEGFNGVGKPCVFPFKYQGVQYKNCITQTFNELWCATTSDYDKDETKGICKLGLTSTLEFNLCAGHTERIYCPAGYLVYIVSAEYAVTSDGSCDYSKKICSASAITNVNSVAGGTPSSNVIHTSRNIDNCNAKSNVLHVEFSCVPDTAPGHPTFTMSSTPQSISDSRVLIQTPNYPSYQANANFQITINVPVNKILSVYVVKAAMQAATIGGVCQNDKLTLQDNVFPDVEKCGTIKPDLAFQSCSTTTVKFVSGATGSILYSGIKLYYEIVDKKPDVFCPTPTPPPTGPTTTTGQTTTLFVPQYVTDGLSSGLETKVVCKTGILDIFNPARISCPSTYIIAIKRSFYGVSKIGQCSYQEGNGDCIVYKDNPSSACVGKESCSFFHISVNLQECSKSSDYLVVEYTCIPTALPAKPMCGGTFTERSGILRTATYPTYDINRCKATITTTVNVNIIKAYIIDMSIDNNCDKDSAVFCDAFNLTCTNYCSQQNAILAIETCNSQLTIDVITAGISDPSLKGALIYYEAIKRPDTFICPSLTLPTTTTTPATTTKAETTTSSRPPNYGLASELKTHVTCTLQSSFACPKDYVIVLVDTLYATNDITSTGCDYSPLDCFETTTVFNIGCSGKQSCSVLYNARDLQSCGKRRSKYVYITYHCVPVVNAGVPTALPNLDLCSSGGADGKITVDSSIIVQSPNYPKYPTGPTKCTKEIVAAPGKALKVFLTDAGFSSATNCNSTNDYVSISDCKQTPPRICGITNYAKILLESVSNSITIDFSTTAIATSSLLKGFQMYIETYSTTATCNNVEPPPSNTTMPPPTYIGNISPLYHSEICVLTEKTLSCPADYYVLVVEEDFISNKVGCVHTPNDCKQQSELAYQRCSSQRECTIFINRTPLPRCLNEYVDYADIEYHCLPATVPSIKTYSCGDTNINAKNGFIASPGYPLYNTGVNCNITVNPMEGYEYRVFLVDLALSEPTATGSCENDYLIINGDPAICSIDSPRLAHVSEKHGVQVQFKSLANNPGSLDGLKGFKLYFEAFSTNPVTTTRPITSRGPITTRIIQGLTLVKNNVHGGSLTGWSLGLGIPALIVIVLVVLVVIRRSNNSSNDSLINTTVNSPRINYTKQTNSEIEDVRSFENPNFNVENTLKAD